jgi:hypothetical protein
MAAHEIESAAKEAAPVQPASPSPTTSSHRHLISKPIFIIGFARCLRVHHSGRHFTLFLSYFLLVSGDSFFKRKMVKNCRVRRSPNKKSRCRALHEIDAQDRDVSYSLQFFISHSRRHRVRVGPRLDRGGWIMRAPGAWRMP